MLGNKRQTYRIRSHCRHCRLNLSQQCVLAGPGTGPVGPGRGGGVGPPSPRCLGGRGSTEGGAARDFRNDEAERLPLPEPWGIACSPAEKSEDHRRRWGDARDSHENCIKAPRGWPVHPSGHGLHFWGSVTRARGGMSPPDPSPCGPPPQVVANSQPALFLLRPDSTPDVQPP